MVIGEFPATYGNVKQVAHDSEDKLTIPTVQVIEEILEQEAEVKKEVMKTKETFQKFMKAWRGATQHA
jgi:hypothetical protein